MSVNNLDVWRDALILDRRGKIWWYNLQFDVSHQNIPSEVNDRFMEAVRETLDVLINYDSPLELLKITTPGFSLQGNRSPEAEPFSRVIDAHAFAHFNVDLEALGLGPSETLKDTIWRMFRKGKIVPERHYLGRMKSAGDFFWGTPTRRLEDAFKELGMCEEDRCAHPPEKGDELA